jgi:N-acetylmuramoyl-L-alanine amidase
MRLGPRRSPYSTAGARAIRLAIALTFANGTIAEPAVAANGAPSFWFAGRALLFESATAMPGDIAVSSADPALAGFLATTGATLAYQPGQRYVVITAADHRTIVFTTGSDRFTAGGVMQQAPFIPYAAGANAYLPFIALAKALYVDAIPDGTATVMQPQLASLEASTVERTTTVTLRGATRLGYERLSAASDERVSLRFDGTATTLEPIRQLPAGGALRAITIQTTGGARNPNTVVTFDVAPGTEHALMPSDSANAIAIAFAQRDVNLPGTPIPAAGVSQPPALTEAPEPPAATAMSSLPVEPSPSAASAQVASVATSADPASGGVRLDIAVTGNAAFTWHRLPDNRWYVDLKPAMLTEPPQDQTLAYDSVMAMRVKGFVGPTDGIPTVRIALTLDAMRDLTIERTNGGLAVHVGAVTDAELDRSGSGQIADGVSGAPPPPAVPVPEPSVASLSGARITGFTTSQSDDGSVNVNLAMTGETSYEWHRISEGRWYVDFKPATLTIPSQDVPLRYAAMPAMRVKAFVGPHDGLATVRIALTLDSARSVALLQTPAGAELTVGSLDSPAAQPVGYGRFVDGTIVATGKPEIDEPPVGVAPLTGAASGSPAWKFSPGAPDKSRLIVLDPGHGGSDSGAMHNGLTEKTITLDIADRLRDLLVSRGWIVKMTRTTDVDVFAPNASARDELQARCDVANSIKARLFVSIHVNSFTTSEQHGTTTYYYRPQSYGLARAVNARLAATLPTTDDGVIKNNFYVIHHTSMPAILVETAFVSNPVDAKYLRSPAFLQNVALGIADGVGDYVSAPPE